MGWRSVSMTFVVLLLTDIQTPIRHCLIIVQWWDRLNNIIIIQNFVYIYIYNCLHIFMIGGVFNSRFLLNLFQYSTGVYETIHRFTQLEGLLLSLLKILSRNTAYKLTLRVSLRKIQGGIMYVLYGIRVYLPRPPYSTGLTTLKTNI